MKALSADTVQVYSFLKN